jgi:AcrR family transcriptional regulator
MAQYSGTGDPKRSLELLWRVAPQPKRGRTPALDIDQIVNVAVALADSDGLAALSMRNVAAGLGKSTMSLYTYVPSKSELLDLMHDAVLRELTTDYVAIVPWRTAIDTYIRDHLAIYLRHPWMAQISLARTALGPGNFAAYEIQTSILARLGLAGTQLCAGATAIELFLNGTARALCDARAATTDTGLTDNQWWETRAPLLAEISEQFQWSERFPTITKLESERVFDQPQRQPDDTASYMEHEIRDGFELVLTLLLNGLATIIGEPRDNHF